MSISPGARIGPYEVLATLGRGGMGVVFRARDTTLHRDVALKLLPDHLASDPDRLSRFEREAQLLASLNHPNIAQIYGQERTDGSGCIVMELVEGETLAEHLAQRSRPGKASALGPRASTGLALDEALEIARQIAAALEAAHARGIVHRDLKPANIKLTPDGKVKVLDFGLAKHGPVGSAGSGEEAAAFAFSHSPTVTRESMPGVMLGTLAYMSPEQARGKPVDARTDIWAFGCVLYEMLTGHQAFDGETAPDVVARVVMGQPDWDRLPSDLPSSIRLLLTSTLNKDPNQRLQNIGDARLFFDPALVPAAPKQVAPNDRRGPRGWLAAGGLAVALIAALTPAVLYFRRSPAEAPQIRFEMAAPGVVGPVNGGSGLTISPDGQRVAYVASVEGKRAVWIRPIGAVAAQPLAGTDGAAWLFWSPDSRYLGFFADGKLKKIDVSGGPAQVLCDAIAARHGAWNRDNVILFTVGTRGLGRVSASGGEVTPVTTVDPSTREIFHILPEFLPDGRHFLYIGTSLSQRTLYVASLDTKSTTQLMALDTLSNGVAWAVRYAAPGHLLFLRNRTLMAQPFDQKQLAVVGAPVPLADGVSDFAASDNGVLVYQKALAQSAASSQLVWFDRSGRQAGLVGTSANYGDLELAPDGQRVAVDIQDVNRDIWVIESRARPPCV
jgi:eukaryotic-like serine/threonine-protein kinase